jgi:hypothetical protein
MLIFITFPPSTGVFGQQSRPKTPYIISPLPKEGGIEGGWDKSPQEVPWNQKCQGTGQQFTLLDLICSESKFIFRKEKVEKSACHSKQLFFPLSF